jgi:hypothetical protein
VSGHRPEGSFDGGNCWVRIGARCERCVPDYGDERMSAMGEVGAARRVEGGSIWITARRASPAAGAMAAKACCSAVSLTG